MAWGSTYHWPPTKAPFLGCQSADLQTSCIVRDSLQTQSLTKTQGRPSWAYAELLLLEVTLCQGVREMGSLRWVMNESKKKRREREIRLLGTFKMQTTNGWGGGGWAQSGMLVTLALKRLGQKNYKLWDLLGYKKKEEEERKWRLGRLTGSCISHHRLTKITFRFTFWED